MAGSSQVAACANPDQIAPPCWYHKHQTRSWWIGVGAICAGALALRVGYVFWLEHPFPLGGDAYVYHFGAKLLVEGKGFIAPYTYNLTGQVHQTAEHPPLFTLALALPTALGLGTVLDNQLWCCLIGTGTVALVAMLGARLGGPRAGLTAAGLAAVYPNMWIPNGTVAVETLSLFMVALVLLSAYRLWADGGSTFSAVLLGVTCALAGLTRAEEVALLPLIVLAWLLGAHRVQLRRRIEVVAIAALAAGLTLGPWVGFNLTRFNRPVLLTTGLPLALVQGNCNQVYYGSKTGYYALSCIPSIPAPQGDESDQDVYLEHVALDYIEAHLSRVPFVVFAREGRAWGFYRPLQQVKLDSYLQGWDLPAAQAGFGMYAAMILFGAYGLVLLRRRRVPISPLLTTVAVVCLATALTFADTRYRVTAEDTVVLLAAVGIDRAWTQYAPALVRSLSRVSQSMAGRMTR